MEKEKKNPWRPTKAIKQDIQDAICHLVATTSMSTRKIVEELRKKIDDAPVYSTVQEWLCHDEDFSDQYARAKDKQLDFLAEELIDIADDDSLDTAFTEDGKPFIDHEHINRSRLRIDTRKWVLAKLKPKKYGDKLVTENTNYDGDKKPVEMSDEEITRILRSRHRPGSGPKKAKKSKKKAS